MKFRFMLIAFGIVVAFLLGTAPANAATGTITNSCAVSQAVHYARTNGSIYFLQCGQTTSGVVWAHAGPRPFYVSSGGVTMCLAAGQRFYPNGYSAVITPTVRC